MAETGVMLQTIADWFVPDVQTRVEAQRILRTAVVEARATITGEGGQIAYLTGVMPTLSVEEMQKADLWQRAVQAAEAVCESHITAWQMARDIYDAQIRAREVVHVDRMNLPENGYATTLKPDPMEAR